ncbi:MAG: hypothetical protein LBV58_01040 [Acholeplasmatales bacterium]|nr:hypothetical protein [Acholeplasmatales bacterium]
MIINDFISRGELQDTIDYKVSVDGKEHIQRINFYKIKRTYSYEINDTRNAFLYPYSEVIQNYKYLIPYQNGDFPITLESPFYENALANSLMSFYFGGHAAMYFDGYIYESVGMVDDFNSATELIFNNLDEKKSYPKMTKNKTSYHMQYGFGDGPSSKYGYYYRDEVMTLRKKDYNEAVLEKTKSFLEDLSQSETKGFYNLAFFVNTKDRYYCSDLISRAYQSALLDSQNQKEFPRVLNDDKFITSVYDLLLSKDSYLTIYFKAHKELIDGKEEMVSNIYFLEDIN